MTWGEIGAAIGRTRAAVRDFAATIRDDLPDRTDRRLLAWMEVVRLPHADADGAKAMSTSVNYFRKKKAKMRAAGFDVWPFTPVYHKHNEGD